MTKTRVARKSKMKAVPAAPAPADRRPTVTTQSSLSAALATTMADAQNAGRDLGAAGMSVAKSSVKLALDVGTVLGLAARNLVNGTVEAAETIVPGRLFARKPLAQAEPRARRGRPRSARAVSG